MALNVGQFLAPSVAADLANCQFFPSDPEALPLPLKSFQISYKISKYLMKYSNI